MSAAAFLPPSVAQVLQAIAEADEGAFVDAFALRGRYFGTLTGTEIVGRSALRGMFRAGLAFFPEIRPEPLERFGCDLEVGLRVAMHVGDQPPVEALMAFDLAEDGAVDAMHMLWFPFRPMGRDPEVPQGLGAVDEGLRPFLAQKLEEAGVEPLRCFGKAPRWGLLVEGEGRRGLSIVGREAQGALHPFRFLWSTCVAEARAS